MSIQASFLHLEEFSKHQLTGVTLHWLKAGSRESSQYLLWLLTALERPSSVCGVKQGEERWKEKERGGGLHVCACAFAATLTFHPFKSLNTSQALKITLGHIPAFSASQKEKNVWNPASQHPKGFMIC